MIEETEKINNNKRLKIKETEDMIRKVLKEFKPENRRVRTEIKIFSTKKQIFYKTKWIWRRKKAREITRKSMEKIDRFKTKKKRYKN